MTFNVMNFAGQVLGGRGLARTNRFDVGIIPPPSLSQYGALVSLLCEQSNFPMLSVGVKPFKIHNTPAHLRPVNIEYGGEGLSFVFHIDGDMIVKSFFDDWMHLIVDPNSFGVNYQDAYATSIFVSQLNEMDMITYQVEFLEAFPRNINLVTLDHSAQNQTHRLTVMFNYRTWRNVQQTIFVERPDPIPRTQPQSYNQDNRTIRR